MTFVEKPLLLDNLAKSLGLAPQEPLEIADFLHDYFLRSLRAELAL